jgi:hypothetical protein
VIFSSLECKFKLQIQIIVKFRTIEFQNNQVLLIQCSSASSYSLFLDTIISLGNLFSNTIYRRTPFLHSHNLHFPVIYNIFSGPLNFPKFIMYCKAFPAIYTTFTPSLQKRKMRDQVSHPYKTTAKITVSYILVFRF